MLRAEIELEGEDLKWRFGLLGWQTGASLCGSSQTQWYEGKGIRYVRVCSNAAE